MKISLNLKGFETPAQLQEYLQAALGFPAYYGRNLDALYDMLTSWDINARFILRLPAAPAGEMAAYLPRLARVFEDAARENRHISVQTRR